MQVSLALDRLLETVSEVAKDMRDEGTKTIRDTSYWVVGGSFFIALLNLFLFRTPRSPVVPSSKSHQANVPESTLPLPNDGPSSLLRTP